MNTILNFNNRNHSKKKNSLMKQKRQSILDNDFYKDQILDIDKNNTEIVSLAYGSRFATENLPKVYYFYH